MAILTRGTFIAALVFGFGCQRSPTFVEVAQRSIAVHAVLVAGSDSATVLITRPMEAPGGTQPIENAHVRFVDGADTIVAVSNARACVLTSSGLEPDRVSSAGCYAAHLPRGVRPGVTYELLVNIPGEAPIRGMTRVPAPPQILEPAAPEPPVLRIGGLGTALTARWTGAAAAARIEVRLLTDRIDCIAILSDAERLSWAYHVLVVTGVDSATIRAMSVQCGQPSADRYSAHLVVTVYDESYTQYRMRTETSSLKTSAGLTGAYGVFGAAANTAVPVVLSTQ